MKKPKTYKKERIISKFNKMSNRAKIDVLMKALDDAEARTDIPKEDFIILSMGFREKTDKSGYINIDELSHEWTEEELLKIKEFYNL